MAEWSNAAVLKTVVPRGTGGSNPSFSARIKRKIKQKPFKSDTCGAFAFWHWSKIMYQKASFQLFQHNVLPIWKVAECGVRFYPPRQKPDAGYQSSKTYCPSYFLYTLLCFRALLFVFIYYCYHFFCVSIVGF
jgi:hypothetical protein